MTTTTISPRPPKSPHTEQLEARKRGAFGGFWRATLFKSSRSKYGWTPLHFAAYEGSNQEVARLFGKGHNIHARSFQGLTPLHLAALQHHDNTVMLLLRYGAEVSARDRQGWTPLHLAVQTGLNLRRLRELGWETDEITYYRDYENFNVITTLVEGGADTKAKTEDGMIPLDYAWDLVETQPRTLKVLWTETARETKTAEAATVASAVVHGQTRVVRLLVCGIDNSEDLYSVYEGHNGLCWAIRAGKLEMVDVLLENGAGVDADCPCGTPALHLAVQTRNKDVVSLFVKYKQRPYFWELDQLSDGVTPVHLAAEQRDGGMLRTLCPFEKNNTQWNIELNARLEVKDEIGRTPLYIAAEAGAREVVSFLLDPERTLYFKIGTEAETVYRQYMRPNELEIASLKGYLDIAESILLFSWQRFDLDLEPTFVGNAVEFALFHHSRTRVLSLRSRFCFAKAMLSNPDYQSPITWSQNPSELSPRAIMRKALMQRQLCAVSFLIHEFNEPFPEEEDEELFLDDETEVMRSFYNLAKDIWPFIAPHADINAYQQGKHVLDITAAHGFGCALQELECVGADVACMEEGGTIALQVALITSQSEGSPSVLGFLLGHGVAPETDKTQAAIPLAVTSAEMTRMLLRRGLRRDLGLAISRARQIATRESIYVAKCLEQFQIDWLQYLDRMIVPPKRSLEGLDYDPNWFINVVDDGERLDSGYSSTTFLF